MKTKKKKPVKPSDCMELYRAVQNYIETRGGSIAVAGGVSIMHTDNRYVYSVCVHVTGQLPRYATTAQPTDRAAREI